jgi:ribonuclease-3
MTPDEALFSRLGHRFHDPQLRLQALTHRSYGAPHNERLEFLGDGVLNCAIASLLYERFPGLPEGHLSRLRANLVNQDSLSRLANALDLGSYLRLGEGELKSGGFRRPSILADALEACFGAVFLDGGYDVAAAVIRRLYEPVIAELDPRDLGKDPKTLLQEFLQGRRLPLPRYNVLAVRGEAHEQSFQVECVIPELDIRTEGEGPSRRSAEQLAARIAYEQATSR